MNPSISPQVKVPRFVELVRVSSKSQSDRDTPAAQRQELERLRTPRAGVFIERIENPVGISGALGVADRPDLQRLKVLSEANAYDELRIFNLDRLTRAEDPRDRFEVYGLVKDAQAIFVDCRGTEIDPNTEIGELQFYFGTKASADERKKILARTSGGRRLAAAGGSKPSGRTLFGFTYDPPRAGRDTGVWGVDEKRAQVVVAMYEWAVQGAAITQIVQRLAAEGVASPTGCATWNTSVIHAMLHDSAYRGEKVYTFGAETFRCKVPAIIGDDLWHAAQAALTRRDVVPVRGEYTRAALLRQRAFCECGALMRVDSSRNNASYRDHYVCARKDRGQPCASRRRYPIDRVDAAVWRVVSQKLSDPEWLKRLLSQLGVGDDGGQWKAQIRACEVKLGQLKKAEAATLRFLSEGLAEQAARDQLLTHARQREMTLRSLELAKRAVEDRTRANAQLVALEERVAALRGKLPSPEFADRDSVIRALVPEDGRLATLHADGRITLHGVISLLGASDGQPTSAVSTRSQKGGGTAVASARTAGSRRAGSTPPRSGYRSAR